MKDYEKIIVEKAETSKSMFCFRNELISKFPELWKWLLEKTSFLPENASITERIFCIKNHIIEIPTCSFCHKNKVKFNFSNGAYAPYCSISCASKDTCGEAIKKRDFKAITEKVKATRLKRYGKYHPDSFAKKLKNTKLAKYGNENWVNTEKAKQTKLERYGNPNFINPEKGALTKLERYGDSKYNNRDKFKKTISAFDEDRKDSIEKKRKSTMMKSYGRTEFLSRKDIKDKIKNTVLKKYGADSFLATDLFKSKMRERYDQQEYFKTIPALSSYATPLFTFEEFKNNRNSELPWKCSSCGTEFNSRYDNGSVVKLCPNCGRTYGFGEETRFFDFIRSIYDGEIIRNSRQAIPPMELDCYLPELKMAFEFDGLFWHSDFRKDSDYHLRKTKLCEKNGIRLVHVFEDEWVFKNRIVKSKIRNMILNTSKRRIFARKCNVVKIDNQFKNKFLEKYHIQGTDISGIRYGLSYNGNIVAVMTFCKSRFNKKYSFELSRYATISNFTIVGGASKLLTHFERDYNYPSIITFADARWSVGNMYFKLGFKLDHRSAPNYFYIKGQKRFSRICFQKHKLGRILKIFDEKLSEKDNMKNNGYNIIFDCGNYVFTKNI